MPVINFPDNPSVGQKTSDERFEWNGIKWVYLPPAPAPGTDGWGPVFAAEIDNDRRVLKVADWVGGTGTKPAVDVYIGSEGFVEDIESAVDIRGPVGANGTTGEPGIPGADAPPSIEIFIELIAEDEQTLFTGLDYDPGRVNVYRSGWLMKRSDYIATDGETLTINDPLTVGEVITIWGFKAIELIVPEEMITQEEFNLIVGGDLSLLSTDDKTNLISAINEIDGKLGNAPDIAELGDLGDLETTDTTTIVAAINEVNSKIDLIIANRTISESAPSGIPLDGQEWIVV